MERSRTVILVVEDEILIRMDVVDQLSLLGYDLLEAANYDQATVILSSGAPIDILFTNIDLYGPAKGLDLVHATSSTFSEVGIVVTSGRSLSCDECLPEGSIFCSKPYSTDELDGAIQQLMSVRRQT